MAKRETTVQRAAREDERRTTRLIAGALAMIIRNKGRVPAAMEKVMRRIKKFKGRVITAADVVEEADLLVEDLSAKKPESERLRETYTVLGREFCEFRGNVSEFLRLVADEIEGKRSKRSYSPGEDWYDGAITRAYIEAIIRYLYPTFSEFLDTFEEQNPKSRGASDRALRRSLRRLGYPTRPDKRGRPKEK